MACTVPCPLSMALPTSTPLKASANMVAPMLRMSAQICISAIPGFLGGAKAVGRLANCARDLNADLKDFSGRLRVNSIITCQLDSASKGLERCSLCELEVFRLDLSGFTGQLTKQEIERGIRRLVSSLSKASALQVLAVRLASFDTSMERVRLGVNSWEALIRCLGELSAYGRLRSLDLSSFNIKTSRATQDVSMSTCPGSSGLQEEALVPSTLCDGPRKLRRAASSPTDGCEGLSPVAAPAGASPTISFLEALTRLPSLEVLVLTYDEIFGDMAKMLPPVFQKMKKLKRVDLTRNNIPKQDMQALRAALPRKVELCGDDLQTFYFY